MSTGDESFGVRPPAPRAETVYVAMPPRRGLFSRLMGLLFFLLVVLPGILLALVFVGAVVSLSRGEEGTISERHHSLSKTATDKIAIITVEGAILDGDGWVKKQIDHVRDDEHVKAVVLRVNSPGGTVTASDYLYHHLRKLVEERKIPLVVSMGGLAASGGYYVAMAVGSEEQSIFAEPTTWTGSIGVIIPHYNVAGLMKKWEIEEDSIKSGPLKQMGTPTRPMTEEERKVFQQLVDDSFGRFQDVVKAGRPKLAADPAALAKVSTGQVFTTNEALANGLVDQQGFIEEAIARAAELSGTHPSSVQAVKYVPPMKLFSLPFSAEARPSVGLAEVLELAAPRAYYLCTWLPTVMAGP